MSRNSITLRVKRSCVHNLRITSATREHIAGEINEGLVLPRELMRLADIAPFEQVIVTKIGGDNWANRMYTFALPGDTDAVEVRGSISHLLAAGELCCVITGSQMQQDDVAAQRDDRGAIPIIDVRYYPDHATVNDLAGVKAVIEYGDRTDRLTSLPDWVLERRQALPRVQLSNLLAGLTIQEVEKRGCIEMSAELPVGLMHKAGFCKNQSIFVYNASRGGASAESYVVPSDTKQTIGISGALTAVADKGDVITEAGFATTFDTILPVVYDARAALALDVGAYGRATV